MATENRQYFNNYKHNYPFYGDFQLICEYKKQNV